MNSSLVFRQAIATDLLSLVLARASNIVEPPRIEEILPTVVEKAGTLELASAAAHVAGKCEQMLGSAQKRLKRGGQDLMSAIALKAQIFDFRRQLKIGQKILVQEGPKDARGNRSGDWAPKAGSSRQLQSLRGLAGRWNQSDAWEPSLESQQAGSGIGLGNQSSQGAEKSYN